MKYITTAVAFVLLLISGTSSAVIIGDKDWRQVTDTMGYSWNNFDSIFDITTGACDAGGCLLGGTVNLTGYTWASNTEVNEVFQFYNGGTGLTLTGSSDVFFNTAPDSLDGLFTAFNLTATLSTSERIVGYTRDQTNGVDFGDWMYALRTPGVGGLDRYVHEIHGNTVTNWGLNTAFGNGGWIYRAVTVPEPSIIALFGLGLLGLGFARRRKQN